MSRRNLKVVVGHRSSAWPGSRWCQPVNWEPRNQLPGMEWDASTGAWVDEQGESAGLILLYADRLQEEQNVVVTADRLRVVTDGQMLPVEI